MIQGILIITGIIIILTLHSHRLILEVVSCIHLLQLSVSANLTISDEECESLLDSKNISLFVDNVSH